MHPRRAGGLTLALGVALLLTPLYWGALRAVGVSAVLDPVAAIGVGPEGGYPATVGAAATTVGGAVIWLGDHGGPSTTAVLAGGLVGAAVGVLVATVLTSGAFLSTALLGLAGAAPGFAAVRGAATDRPRRRLGTWLVALSLAPLAATHVVRGVAAGGLGGFASLVLAVALVVYTAVISHPFYRLGRVVRRAEERQPL